MLILSLSLLLDYLNMRGGKVILRALQAPEVSSKSLIQRK